MRHWAERKEVKSEEMKYKCLNNPVSNPIKDRQRCRLLNSFMEKQITLFSSFVLSRFWNPAHTPTTLTKLCALQYSCLFLCVCETGWKSGKNLRLLIQSENYAVFFNWFKLLAEWYGRLHTARLQIERRYQRAETIRTKRGREKIEHEIKCTTK